jgi:hypothetical protein
MDTRLAGVTVTTKLEEAVAQTLGIAQSPLMVAVPAPIALTLPELLTVATEGAEEVHVISAVTSARLLSAYTAVALSCVEVPFAKLAWVAVI